MAVFVHYDRVRSVMAVCVQTLSEKPTSKDVVRILFQPDKKGVHNSFHHVFSGKLGQVARDRNVIYIGALFEEDVPMDTLFDESGYLMYQWGIVVEKFFKLLQSKDDTFVLEGIDLLDENCREKFLVSWFQGYKAHEAQLIKVFAPDHSEVVNRSAILANDYHWCALQISEPSNDLTPGEFARRILGIFPQAEVLAGEEILMYGLKLTHAVGQSPRATQEHGDHRPHFAKVKIGSGKQVLTLVGKGVTFDSGGFNLKPSKGMTDMHKDMAGAAFVLSLASSMQDFIPEAWSVEILIPLVENGFAINPGDILSIASQRVQIGNTDAEGRLLIADSYQVVKPNSRYVIDCATMTGTAWVIGDKHSIFAQGHRDLGRKFEYVSYQHGLVNYYFPTHPGIQEGLITEGVIANVQQGFSLQTPYLFLDYNFRQLHPESQAQHLFLDIAGPGVKGGLAQQFPAMRQFLLNLMNAE